MTWYVVICGGIAFVYILWNATRRTMSWKGMALGSVLFLLWFFASFRATSVGADTKNYEALFSQLRDMSPMEMLNSNIFGWSYLYYISWELGFKIICYIYLRIFFFLPSRSALSFVSFLTLLFLGKAVKQQNTVYPFLSIWLYVTLGFYQTSLNMAQNALAIAILLWAIKFIKSDKPVYWCIAVACAAAIHLSSLFFLPMYWLSKHKYTTRQYYILFALIVAIALFSNRVIALIARAVPAGYRHYLYSSESARSELLVLVLHMVLILPVSLFTGSKPINIRHLQIARRRQFLQPYFSFFIAEIVLYLLALSSSGFLRGATLFSPAVIVYIPNLINGIENKNNRLLILIYIVFVSLLGYLLRLSINNIGSTQPYKFFWWG